MHSTCTIWITDTIKCLVTSTGWYVNIWGYKLPTSTMNIYWKGHKWPGSHKWPGTTIMWDVHIITDQAILTNRPHSVLHHKNEKTCLLINIAIPDDQKLTQKKLKNLEIKVSRMWKVETHQEIMLTFTAHIICKLLGKTARISCWDLDFTSRPPNNWHAGIKKLIIIIITRHKAWYLKYHDLHHIVAQTSGNEFSRTPRLRASLWPLSLP